MISKGASISEVVKKKRIRKKKVVAETGFGWFVAMGVMKHKDGTFSRVDLMVNGDKANILFVEEPMSRHNVRLDFSIAAQKRILDVL